MTLNDFLSSHGISKVVFAQKLNTTVATVSRISDGLVTPRRDLMKRIYTVTEGAVTPNDLVGLYCVHPCENVRRRRNQQDD